MSSEAASPAGDFFYVNKIIYRICGIWIPGKHISLPLRVLYYSYVLTFYSLFVVFAIFEFVIFKDMLTEISKFVNYFGMLFTHVVGFLKISILTLQYDRIKKIMKTLQNLRYNYYPMEDFQPEALLGESKTISSIASVLVFVLYGFVGISAHITSHIRMNQVVMNHTLEGNMTCLDFIPFYFYLPFTGSTKDHCEYIFMFMDLGYGIHAFVIACHDGIFTSLLNSLRTHLIITGAAFKTIRQRCLKDLGMPTDFFVLHEEENPEVEKVIHEEMTHCIKNLNILLRIRDDIEYCFSYVTLAQSLASLFILASCLYISSTVPVTSPEFFSQLEYFLCILTQLSLMCWFGNEITLASSRVPLSLYEGDWFSASPRFKRSMILTMCRMQRPLYLSIGKFSPLTLATLVAVCRGSFSYYAVLQSIQ